MRPLKTLLLISALAAIGCAKEEDGGGGTSNDEPEECDEDGALVYVDNCAGCHGTDGDEGFATDLSTSVPSLSDEALDGVLVDGVDGTPGMDPVSMTDCARDALFIYLRDTFGDEGGR
jgi:mono/diheme cytochrome c family protein